MTLKDAADLATAMTLIVATVTFVLAFAEHRERERQKLALETQKLVQNWQRVVVYRIIEQGHVDFDLIKMRYLGEAQQLFTFDLPNSEIQDDALQLALLTLIKERLISKTTDGGYVINAVSLEENEMKNFALAQMQQRKAQNALISRLFEILEVDSGKFSIDQLYRHFGAEGLGYKFEDFDILVREQISRGGIVISTPSQRLWLRAKLPQSQLTPQQSNKV